MHSYKWHFLSIFSFNLQIYRLSSYLSFYFFKEISQQTLNAQSSPRKHHLKGVLFQKNSQKMWLTQHVVFIDFALLMYVCCKSSEYVPPLYWQHVREGSSIVYMACMWPIVTFCARRHSLVKGVSEEKKKKKKVCETTFLVICLITTNVLCFDPTLVNQGSA